MNAGLLLVPALVDDPTAPALCARLAARGVPVVVLGDIGPLTEVVRCQAVDPARGMTPRMLLLACRDHTLDAAATWLLTRDPGMIPSAATAGLAGVVLIGAEPPPGDHGLVVARADDCGDAPRVMVPRAGGCWHEAKTPVVHGLTDGSPEQSAGQRPIEVPAKGSPEQSAGGGAGAAAGGSRPEACDLPSAERSGAGRPTEKRWAQKIAGGDAPTFPSAQQMETSADQGWGVRGAKPPET